MDTETRIHRAIAEYQCKSWRTSWKFFTIAEYLNHETKLKFDACIIPRATPRRKLPWPSTRPTTRWPSPLDLPWSRLRRRERETLSLPWSWNSWTSFQLWQAQTLEPRSIFPSSGQALPTYHQLYRHRVELKRKLILLRSLLPYNIDFYIP